MIRPKSDFTPKRVRHPYKHHKRPSRVAIPQAAVHPIILSPWLINSVSQFDDLKLSQSLAKRLNEASYISKTDTTGGIKTVYIDVREMSGAVVPRGTYIVRGQVVEVSLVLVKNDRVISRLDVSGSTSALAS